MRCFLAVDLPEEVRNELAELQNEIKKLGVVAKFVEKENLHLTLQFFGEISDKAAKEIEKKLGSLSFSKIKANLGQIGFFPNNNFINIIWVSLEPSETFRQLFEEINLNLKMKDKRFESHITLARVKKIKDKEEFLNKIDKIKVKGISFEVKRFVLKKSTLTSKGPIYEDVKEFKLS